MTLRDDLQVFVVNIHCALKKERANEDDSIIVVSSFYVFGGAADGNRTHLSSLGSSHSTDELQPHRILYYYSIFHRWFVYRYNLLQNIGFEYELLYR